MGYTYEKNYETGRWLLCCDICGKAGGVRKHRCPYGYCPSLALCSSCAKTHKPQPKNHQRCKIAAAEFQAQRERRQILINDGYMLRCSAINTDAGVKVTFRGNKGKSEYLMTKETYRSIPLLFPATIENFMDYGEVTVI